MATARRKPLHAKRATGSAAAGDRSEAGRRSWPVQEARARLSQLIDEALAGRPQPISRRGKEVAVVISAAEYERLVTPRQSLLEFFRNSPLAKVMAEDELDFERDRSPIRDLPL
jgi:prevent-host-death family protein